MQYNLGDEFVVDVADVISIAKLTAKAIMEVYTEDNSPDALGNAIALADMILFSSLSNKYPNIPIISDNNKMTELLKRNDYKCFFCVDPLNGPKDFAARNGQFSINVGLCERGCPVLGVVVVPALESPRVYFSVRGYGAFLQEDKTEETIRLRVSTFSDNDDDVRVVVSASHNAASVTRFIRLKYRQPRLVPQKGVLRLLLVAEGKADVFPWLSPSSEWETCAAHAIVTAAGGQVLAVQEIVDEVHGTEKIVVSDEALTYNKPVPLNPPFVVMGRTVSSPKHGRWQVEQLSNQTAVESLDPTSTTDPVIRDTDTDSLEDPSELKTESDLELDHSTDVPEKSVISNTNIDNNEMVDIAEKRRVTYWNSIRLTSLLIATIAVIISACRAFPFFSNNDQLI